MTGLDLDPAVVGEVWPEIAAVLEHEVTGRPAGLDLEPVYIDIARRTVVTSAPGLFVARCGREAIEAASEHATCLLGGGRVNIEVTVGRNDDIWAWWELDVCQPLSEDPGQEGGLDNDIIQFYEQVLGFREINRVFVTDIGNAVPPLKLSDTINPFSGKTHGNIYLIEVWCRPGCCFIGYYIGRSAKPKRRAYQHYTDLEEPGGETGWANPMIYAAYEAGLAIKFYIIGELNDPALEAAFIHSADHRCFNKKHISIEEEDCALCVAGFGIWGNLDLPIRSDNHYGVRGPLYEWRRPCVECATFRPPPEPGN